MANNKGAKIIIIEDEKILSDVLSKKLDNEGFRVFSAADGEEGMALIEKIKPDLVLLDILMPKMNGYEVLEKMGEKYGRQEMPPVIIISNSGQPVEIDRARNLGARDFIVKAVFTPEEVIQKVKLLLNSNVSDSGSVTKDGVSSQPSESNSASGDKSKFEANILIVEDDQFLRELLRTKLEKENFKVATAIDGPSGIDKIISLKPDIVLLDIILPGIDGFEILKRVRSNADMQLANVPIILLSNLGQEADVEKGQALGADDYLIKSNFTIDEIIEKIRKILNK